jgi:SAM-dependent methyltransferase
VAATAPRPAAGATPLLFALAIFTSAALVFMIEPMIAKLILPKLGGSPAVWNTSMVFFQIALLLGYGYAHLIQRVQSLHRQIMIHVGLLVVAALALPLRVNGLLGDPPTGLPIPWLLGELGLSIGAPFAVLSATAPLLQAWYARVRAGEPDAQNPYVLYAASNLGSFISLLAYPAIVEPLLRLSTQRVLWTGGYVVFIAVIVALGVLIWRAKAEPPPPLEATAEVPWREKLIWVLLAAAPSSLMLGVTMHLTVDIASAPFLWVIPLALYLLTFVLAFQAKPLIPLKYTLAIQAATAAIGVALLPFTTFGWNVIPPWVPTFVANVAVFFFTALMCHQMLAGRRPPPDRLTEFYFWLAVGGVVGGVFNALIAPLIFTTVREYPLVLLAATFARPNIIRKAEARDKVAFGVAVLFSAICWSIYAVLRAWPKAYSAVYHALGNTEPETFAYLFIFFAAIAAFMAKRRTVLFAIALIALWFGAQNVAQRYDWKHSERSFFGVLRVADYPVPQFKNPHFMIMMNGTTLHGGESMDPTLLCRPMLYYAPTTSIGQAVAMVQARGPRQDIGVVGLGSGGLAAYERPTDTLTYFEIDPKVLHFAMNPQWFSYANRCRKGPLQIVMGDARLSLQKQPANKFDLLVVDAFSSDSVPTHLLTEEALRTYLRVIKPDGVVLLHLSNRNLEIDSSAAATAKAIGAPVLEQNYVEDSTKAYGLDASTDVVIFARNPQALADFAADDRWAPPPKSTTRPWTDDYTNLIGALWRRLRDNWQTADETQQ